VAQAVGDFVDDGCGGAGGVLRVERDDQDARAAGGAHGVELAADRRLAVAHGPAHVELALAGVGEKAGQQLGLLFGVDLERRAFVGPHAGVFFGRLGGPGVQDDAVEDQPPDRPGISTTRGSDRNSLR
jgi:hypothetical protein